MTEAERAELVRRIVDQAPPITAEQRERVQALLRRDDAPSESAAA